MFLIFTSLQCANHGITMFLKCLSCSRLPEGLSVGTEAGDRICRNYPLRFLQGNVMRSDTQKKNSYLPRVCHKCSVHESLWYPVWVWFVISKFFAFCTVFSWDLQDIVPAIRSMITIFRSDYSFMESNGRMMCYQISAKCVISIPRIRYRSSGLFRNVRNHIPDYTKLQWNGHWV